MIKVGQIWQQSNGYKIVDDEELKQDDKKF